MTNDEIRAIATEALEHDQAATPGPWRQDTCEPCALVQSARLSMSLLGLDKDGLAILYREADAAAIAHARTAAPSLAKSVLGVLDGTATPPLTVGHALGDGLPRAGEAIEWWCGVWWCQIRRVDGEFGFSSYSWWGGEWWAHKLIQHTDYPVPCRIVPAAEVDSDPTTRGPIGDWRGEAVTPTTHTLASALGSEEFAAGTHVVEWFYRRGRWQLRADVKRIVTQYKWCRPRWRAGPEIGTFVRMPARLVPLADADLDPATRGAL